MKTLTEKTTFDSFESLEKNIDKLSLPTMYIWLQSQIKDFTKNRSYLFKSFEVSISVNIENIEDSE